MDDRASEVLRLSDAGLYCPAGDFHIDPWRPVARAVITHAHADHARGGSVAYLAAAEGLPLLRARLPTEATIATLRYGEVRRIGDADISFHPAGHVLGSAQVRIAVRSHTLVVSGDYKLAPDSTCTPFEPVRCHTFVTESTFGLPIYRWEEPDRTLTAILRWWTQNRAEGRASILFAYALGKAQRLAAGLANVAGTLPGPIYVHGAIARINAAYRAAGVALPPTTYVGDALADARWSDALILAPPSARASRWLARFEPLATAFASGWMAIRGPRRRASLDRGFALSDHADWPGLNSAIAGSGADEVWVTHGYRDEMVRWLNELGYAAKAIETRFEGEQGAETPAEDLAPAAPETPADEPPPTPSGVEDPPATAGPA